MPASKKRKPDLTDGAERQRRYHVRMRAAGLTRIGTWVPESRRLEFAKVIENLRKRWIAEGLYPDNDGDQQ
jgi:hypothetical protein